MSDCRVHGSQGYLADPRTGPPGLPLPASPVGEKRSPATSSVGSSEAGATCPELRRAIRSVRYMAECTKQEEESNKVEHKT